MFHKILRMLYLIYINVNLLNNNRELLRDNGDLNVDRNIQENILRVISNIFHSLLVDEY